MSASSIGPSSYTQRASARAFLSARFDLCVICAAGICRPNLNVCSALGTGEIQPPPSDSQEVTLRVLSRAVDEQRGHVARSTAREMLDFGRAF